LKFVVYHGILVVYSDVCLFRSRLHNLTFEDAIELALDMSLWRLLVASGATH